MQFKTFSRRSHLTCSESHTWYPFYEDGQTKRIHLTYIYILQGKKNVYGVFPGVGLPLLWLNVYVCVQLSIHDRLYFPPSGPPLQLLTVIWTQCTWTFLHPVSIAVRTCILASCLLHFLPCSQLLPVLPYLPSVLKQEQGTGASVRW